MTLAELILSAKNLSDDQPGRVDSLWSDSEWTEYANEAERQACIRANLLIDSASAITSIPIVAGLSIYSVDPKILTIRRAKLSGGTEPLVKTSRKVLDVTYPDWENESGTVRSWFPDDTNKIGLYRKPIAPGTLNLMVSRLPLADMLEADKDSVSPEINSQYHIGLVQWMLHKAYSKQDSETLDIGKSEKHLKLFTEQFGELPPIAQNRI